MISFVVSSARFYTRKYRSGIFFYHYLISASFVMCDIDIYSRICILFLIYISNHLLESFTAELISPRKWDIFFLPIIFTLSVLIFSSSFLYFGQINFFCACPCESELSHRKSTLDSIFFRAPSLFYNQKFFSLSAKINFTCIQNVSEKLLRVHK